MMFWRSVGDNGYLLFGCDYACILYFIQCLILSWRKRAFKIILQVYEVK